MIIPPAARRFLKRTPAYAILWHCRQRKQITDWRKSGYPLPPPPAVKQKVVAEYARLFGVNTLIETGTFAGDMVEATRKVFRRIYSIELDEMLFRQATARFERFRHITIMHGDSGTILAELLNDITEPSLFWLDGHYSGETTAKGEEESPVLREIAAILDHSCSNHVVLIDDARCFTGGCGYPTISALQMLFKSKRPHWVFELKHDIVRTFPANWAC